MERNVDEKGWWLRVEIEVANYCSCCHFFDVSNGISTQSSLLPRHLTRPNGSYFIFASEMSPRKQFQLLHPMGGVFASPLSAPKHPVTISIAAKTTARTAIFKLYCDIFHWKEKNRHGFKEEHVSTKAGKANHTAMQCESLSLYYLLFFNKSAGQKN